MRERAIRFGKSAILAGVVTEPSGPRDDQRPAVILLNSGILHHIGACRLHVRIARRLAAEGFTVLRFDHAGIGDSEPRRDTLSFEESAVLEATEAMDHLQARGHRRFLLMGLCSGADMAFRVAGMDARVMGIAQMDAYAYRTRGYWVRYYRARIQSPAAWSNFLRHRARRLASWAAGRAPAGIQRDPAQVTSGYRRKFPPREQVEAELRILLGRDVRLLFIFSGGQDEHYNHREQYAASFPTIDFRDRLRVEFFPEADHIFTGLDHQRLVIETIAEWTAGVAAATEPATPTLPPSSPSTPPAWTGKGHADRAALR